MCGHDAALDQFDAGAGLSPELADTLEMTARLRRHPTAGNLRAALRGAGLDPAELFLLTLDGIGPGDSVGLLVDRQGRSMEFEHRGSRAVVRQCDRASDPLVVELSLWLSKFSWPEVQQAVEDVSL